MLAFSSAMIQVVLLASLGLLLPTQVIAQSNLTKATCLPGFQWSFNSEGDSPCTIAMDLAGVCIGTDFTLAPLDPGFVYLGPDAVNANSCRCSSVYYSLLSACATCQDREYINWSTYKSNCTRVYSQVFLEPIPQGLGVPHYAYLDVATSGTFNITAASTAGGPESTSLPSATASGSSISPSQTIPVPPSGKKSNTGAIAGGVVGGIVALLAIGGLVFWLLRRRQTAESPSTPSSYEPKLMATPSQYPTTIAESNYATAHAPTPTPRVYDPNDPTTFPIHHDTGNMSYSPYSPYNSSPDPAHNQGVYPAQMAQHFTGNSASGAFPQSPTRPHYTGAPEL